MPEIHWESLLRNEYFSRWRRMIKTRDNCIDLETVSWLETCRADLDTEGLESVGKGRF